jgi:RNA polymerase sigma-70 factor (ECF subfamily)
MPAITDRELIRRFRAGDDDALAALFSRYEDVLAARIRHRLPPPLRRKVSVADVLQETRIVVFRRREDFESRDKGAFRKWVLGIADNKARAAAQRYGGVAKRNVYEEVSAGRRPETREIAGHGPSPSQVVIASELRDLARRALSALPEDYREIVRLVREEQLPLREAARRLGRSYEATKKLYGRALLRFTETFDRLRGTEG